MSMLEEIVEAIASAEGVDPTELNLQLHNYIDTDAVRALAAHESESWSLQFETPNHAVRLTGHGVVLVDDSEPSILD